MINNPNPKNDDFARGSFGMRRMSPWQLWGITVVAIAAIAVAAVYLL